MVVVRVVVAVTGVVLVSGEKAASGVWCDCGVGHVLYVVVENEVR